MIFKEKKVDTKISDEVIQVVDSYNDISQNIKNTNNIISIYDAKLNVSKIKVTDYENSILIFNHVISNDCSEVIENFQNVISGALKDIFDNSYEFKFELSKKSKMVSCNFLLHTSEYPGFIDIAMTHGRSVKEVIGVILRLLVIHIDSNSNKTLILDEPFGGLEPDRQIVAAEFLKKVAEKLNIQLIIVTQDEEYLRIADKGLII